MKNPDSPPSGNTFLSCDWGTTTFRLKWINHLTGEEYAAYEDSRGIQDTYNRLKELSGPTEREIWFLQQLERQIDRLEKKADTDLSGLPLLLSGMASSSIGLRELPYGSLPLDLSGPGTPVEQIPENGPGLPIERIPFKKNPVYLISGLQSGKNDVMRGEEAALIGLGSGNGIDNGLCILPGTHSKHAFIEEGKLTRFQTYMTGEVFALLGTHSILRNSITKPIAEPDPEWFLEGVRTAREKPLLHALFTIRAGDLLLGHSATDNYAFLSGLLIGSELAGLAGSNPEPVILAGTGALRNLYGSALNALNIPFTSIPADKDLVAAGHIVILNHMLNRQA